MCNEVDKVVRGHNQFTRCGIVYDARNQHTVSTTFRWVEEQRSADARAFPTFDAVSTASLPVTE